MTTRECTIEGCSGLGVKRTWCEKHYQRWKHHGDPTFTKGPPTGRGHGNWKGGKTKNKYGYVMVTVSRDDPFYGMSSIATKYTRQIPEHRYVMAQHLGRPLTRSETVHHINGIRDDNRIENLQLRQGQHGKGVASVCLDCGSHNIGAEQL